MKYAIIFFVLFGCGQGFGQNEADQDIHYAITIHVDEKNAAQSQLIQSAFKMAYADELEIKINSIFELSVGATFGEPRTIEGMDTRTYVKGKFKVALTNMLTGKNIWSETFQTNGKATQTRQATRNAIDKLASNAQLREQLMAHLQVEYEALFIQNCHTTLEQIPAVGSWNELNMAFEALQYFEGGSCAEMAERKLLKVSQAQDELSCKTSIHELTILIESGEFNPSEVVSKLLAISPDAPCADDAINLAKRVGEMRNKLGNGQHQVMNQYLQVVLLSDPVVRRMMHRRLRWRY